MISNIARSRNNRRPALAGQQLHSDAGHDQIDLKFRRGDRHGFVASQYCRTFSFALPDPRWGVSEVR